MCMKKQTLVRDAAVMLLALFDKKEKLKLQG